jgi:hypothetical protein
VPTPNSHGSHGPKMSSTPVSMPRYRHEARKALAVMLGITPGRIHQLILEGRVYPCRKTGASWVMLGNSVIIAPHDRHGR